MDEWKTLLAALIFAFTYLIVVFQRFPRMRVDRPGGALMGAVLMVACGVLPFEDAWKAIDGRTIVLLLGMMILNVFLEDSGFFEQCCRRLLRYAHAPVRLLIGLAWLSGILSAFFLNDTVCLMLTPPLLLLLRRARLPALPYLITLAMSANVGSVMTITGNPQNMLIGIHSGWSYGGFFVRMLPVGVIGLAAMVAILVSHYRKPLEEAALASRNNPAPIEDPLPGAEDQARQRKLLRKCLIVMGAVLIGFAAGGEMPVVAMAGAVAMIVWSHGPPVAALERVNWVLLLFFAGLFVVVGGIQETHLVDQAIDWLRPLHGASLASQIAIFSTETVVASNIVSNVPFVLLAKDMAPTFDHPPVMWLTLAMASTFAGNLSIPGSVATLIVLESAKEQGKIGFIEFLRVGIPVTIITVFLGGLVLFLEVWIGLT